ncbi:MAG: DegT/DnrJ/EryC1/StrS family aminotransferase [Alphaproteobacteria bacterium]|nr:DegT/DnrJ/EryC1/StrS family aminotransferase [Alphaproteobacteria bacterium]
MQINDLSSKISNNRAFIRAAIDRVIDRGWVILGPEVKQFETSFAAYLGAHHCISVANGTDAIELALKALEVNKGDCVATVANAGMYTTTALLAIGALPFFLDVDKMTHNTTLAEVERAIKEGAKAVVVTHLYGLAVPEIENIALLCRQNGVPLLEDCAQAHGAMMNGKRVGTFGDASSFSFYPTKNLGALGDGGAIVTNSSAVAEKISRLRQYGWTAKYRVEIPGARNSRLDEMQAAILLAFLPSLDSSNDRRREVAKQYNEKIHHPKIDVPGHHGNGYVAHLYVVRSQDRDSLRAHLQSLDIASDVHYPIPDYRQPVFGGHFSGTHLENTDCLASEVLTLPCYPEMTDREVDQVISAVNAWQS